MANRGMTPGAKPSPRNMTACEHGIENPKRVRWAKAEGTEQRNGLDFLKRTLKYSILYFGDDEELTLPDPETARVYSLN